MIPLLFTIVLIILNVHCFKKKKYLVLFVSCMLFLPDFYGIDISDNIPVISAVRIMFIVFLIYSIIYRKNSLSDLWQVFKRHRSLWLLAGYYIFRVISNAYYFTVNNYAKKTIFELAFEQLLFIICLWMLSPAEDDIKEVIATLVNVAAVHFAIGIFESFTTLRPFDLLYTVDRYMLNEHFYRMDVLRATTTFGLPGLYGNMCVLMLPLLIYQIRNTGNRVYLIHLYLCAMAIVHSGSRADIFFFAFAAFLYIVYILITDRKKWKELLINSALVGLMVVTTIVLVSSVSTGFRYFYQGTYKSVLNEVGAEYDLDQNAPAGSGGYGENPDGTDSRVAQLSGIVYAMSQNPLFGLGSGAQNRGIIKYLRGDVWKNSNTYDLGYVQVFMDEGILGAIGYCLLFLFIFAGAFRSMKKSRELSALLIIYALAYLCCMLSTANLKYLLLFEYVMVFALLVAVEFDRKGNNNV